MLPYAKPSARGIAVVITYVTILLVGYQTASSQSFPDIITGIDWNLTGTEIAIAGGAYPCSDGGSFPLRVLTVATGIVREISTGGSCPQSDVDWSPDGSKVAISQDLGHGVIIGVDPETILGDYTLPEGLEGFQVVWNPNGTAIASTSGAYSAWIWNPVTGEVLSIVGEHDAPITMVAWRPDGSQLATSSLDGTVRVWDVDAPLDENLRLQHPGRVWWAAFSPDGSLIATAGEHGFVGLWNAQDGSLIRNFVGHTEYVYTLDWSPDGTRLATGGSDKTVRTWDVASGQLLDVVKSDVGTVIDLDWNPVNDQIAFIGIETGYQDGLPDLFEASEPLVPTPTPCQG